MMTYRNGTASAATIEFLAGGEQRSILVAIGALLTFDETESNGDDITSACETAGLTQV